MKTTQNETENVNVKEKQYVVNEVFYSLQGEGIRAGTPNVFVRFTGCNLQCSVEEGPKSPGGFDCDTEFASGRKMTLWELELAIWEAIQIATEDEELEAALVAAKVGKPQEFKIRRPPNQPQLWIIFTGGEPALQVDRVLCEYFHDVGFKLAIETNGSIALSKDEKCLGPMAAIYHDYIDWITVSPKVAEHAIRQTYADEVKYVRGYGQAIPKTVITSPNKLISPAFNGNELDKKTLQWCIKLVLDNPEWRLSPQMHKLWKVR